MNKLPIIPIANLSLRLLVLIAKFFFVILLGVYLSLEEVGLYGLLVSTIGYLILLAGFNTYIIANREIVNSDYDTRHSIVANQLKLFLISYIVLLPFLYYIYDQLNLDKIDFIVFCLLFISEHISQEITRLLLSLGKVVESSIVIFIRLGAWCFLVAFLYNYFEAYRYLNLAIASWLSFSFISVIVGWIFLSELSFRKVFEEKFDWQWLKSTLIIATPLFLATLAIKMPFVIDRQLIAKIDLNILGGYVFYTGLARAVTIFNDSFFLQPSLNKLLTLSSKSPKEFKIVVRNMIPKMVFVCLVFTVVFWYSIPFTLRYFGKVNLLDYFYIFPYLCVLYSFQSIHNLLQVACNSLKYYKEVYVSSFIVTFGFLLSIFFLYDIINVLLIIKIISVTLLLQMLYYSSIIFVKTSDAAV